MNIICSGPGPHVPVSGILGTASVPQPGIRCASSACSYPLISEDNPGPSAPPTAAEAFAQMAAAAADPNTTQDQKVAAILDTLAQAAGS